jgi:ATP-dependent protease ClpP protease subunit
MLHKHKYGQVKEIEEIKKTNGEEDLPYMFENVIDKDNNHIYYYGPISHSNVLNLVQLIRTVDLENQNAKIKWDLLDPPPIHIHLNSYGGNFHAGMAAYRSVLNATSPVYIHNEGAVASAATFMAVAADYRDIGAEGLFCIHQISGAFRGKYYEFVDEKENFDKEMEVMNKVYLQHTKLTQKDIDQIMRRDLWFTAEEALKKGLVDEILE